MTDTNTNTGYLPTPFPPPAIITRTVVESSRASAAGIPRNFPRALRA